MTNQELQAAINALLAFYSVERKWCQNGAPDGAITDALCSLLQEQTKRAENAQ
jgi:hypothetical protein